MQLLLLYGDYAHTLCRNVKELARAQCIHIALTYVYYIECAYLKQYAKIHKIALCNLGVLHLILHIYLCKPECLVSAKARES